MKYLIEEWERLAKKYRELGLKATDPIRAEGLLCRSDVYDYCADKLRRASQQGAPADGKEIAVCPECGCYHSPGGNTLCRR